MSAILLIHALDDDQQVMKTYTYSKADELPLNRVTTLEELTVGPTKVYQTGLDALGTEKRLLARLGELFPNSKFKIERKPVEDRQVMHSRVHHGGIPPLKVRGG